MFLFFFVSVFFFRCAIPGLSNDTFEIQNEQHAQLIAEYIPVAADGTLSSCDIYERKFNRFAEIFGNGTKIISCDRWVYDTSIFVDTVITEVGLHFREAQSFIHTL